MGVRQWINENSTVAAAVAAAVAVVALTALIWQATGSGTGAPSEAYYYDAREDAFFVGPFDAYPPIETPHGETAGVRAHIFACGGCPRNIVGETMAGLTEQGAFVAYLERYEEEAKRALEAHRADPQPEDVAVLGLEESGRLVSTPDTSRWVPLDSESGMRMVDSALEEPCDDGVPPVRCLP